MPDSSRRRPNIVLITADDLNWDSVGANGCPLRATPSLDRLAAEGMRFVHAHTPEAVCQPSRQMLCTGRYPHNYGAIGFHPFAEDVPTLGARLADAGYLNAILGKVSHYGPLAAHRWERVHDFEELGFGRDPASYRRFAEAVLADAAAEGRPFFLVANCHDPHRPFSGSEQERRSFGEGVPPSPRQYAPEEVPVPGFLPELPAVRQEIAEYFASVARLDASVGGILDALDAAGCADDCLVVFASDHGMALPFAKTTCYRHGTRSPWLLRWPGVVAPGMVEDAHCLSNVDLAPTIIEALELEPLLGIDGRSFLPLLHDAPQAGRERVFTFFNRTAAGRDYPSRALQDRRFGYICNFWADGRSEFRNESMSGRSMAAMRAAADDDPAIAARVAHFLHRAPEELYDYRADPDALVNLIDDPAHAERVRDLRAELQDIMRRCGDPMSERLAQRFAEP